MDPLSNLYSYTYTNVFRENDFIFSVSMTSLINMVLYFGLGGLFLYTDMTGRPRWMLKYRVQPDVTQQLTSSELWRVLKLDLVNLVVVSLPVVFFLYPLQTYRGCSCRPENLPGAATVLRDLVCIIASREVCFYYLHRLVHWGPLYRHIHKIHHEFKTPFALTSVYAHPLEHIFVHLTTVMIPPLLLGSHTFTTCLWYAIMLTFSLLVHCGYHLPFMLSPELHDYHHVKFVCNYGDLGFMDWLHGTSSMYTTTQQYKRDKVLLGLTPLTQVYPDKKKQ